MPLTGSARSAPKPLPISRLLHSQYLSDDRHKDVKNKALVKNRLASFVFEHRHPLNIQPKGMYKAEGAGHVRGRGVTTKTKTPATPPGRAT